MRFLIKKIKSSKWFFGVRAEESLFFYSAKYFKREKLTKKYYQSNFVETLLFPLRNDYPVRVFNLRQAKRFHQESKNKIFKNPQIILRFIDLDNKNWQGVKRISKKLLKAIKLSQFKESQELFKKLIVKYGEYGNLFFINFSLGMVMTEQQTEFKNNILPILKKHNQWRNSVAFKEEELGEIFYKFFKMLIGHKKLSVKPLAMMKYLTVWEVLDYIQNKLANNELEKIIKARQEKGYIFSCLRSNSCQGVISDKKMIKQVAEYFNRLLAEDVKSSKALKGLVAYSSGVKINGRVVVIKDKNVLGKNKINLKGKILVAIQTTPHFTPYLKGVKGIITDEGGITCHAAIVSREFKIPCIIGAKNATQVLKNGDMVEVDTQKGIIKKFK